MSARLQPMVGPVRVAPGVMVVVLRMQVPVVWVQRMRMAMVRMQVVLVVRVMA